jgi:hypothetical protein
MNRGAKRGAFSLFILLTVLAHIAIGQIQVNSPYTRFGVGNIVEKGLNPRTFGMGGLTYGIQMRDLVNPANPASYMAFDSSTFIFDAGIFGMGVNLQTDKLTQSSTYISLSHLLFGFPVTNWWKTSVGVLPFSYVGYDIHNTEYLDGITTVANYFNGSGGYNQLYWGNAFRLGKKLSIGINIKYLFGTIDKVRAINFPDSTEMKNTFIKSSVTASDIYGDIGIQYKTKIGDKMDLVVGGVFGPQVNIRTRGSLLTTTYFGDIYNFIYTRDTIVFEDDKPGSFVMPIRTGAGFSLGMPNHWLAGFDFTWQNWEKYKIYGVSDSLKNLWTIAVGGQYIPNYRSISSYFQRVTYRFGFHYTKTPLYLKEQQISEFGISFGLTLPIRKTRSTINASMEVGRKGTTVNGLIQENYIRFTLGVNIFENWFVKSKYF